MKSLPPQLIRRTARIALTCLAAAACTESANIAGKAPERTRELDDAGGPIVRNREALYEKRVADAAAGGGRVEKTVASEAVVGVAATRKYHRPDCALVKGVPQAEQVQFATVFDGLDGNYSPCDVCRPGP